MHCYFYNNEFTKNKNPIKMKNKFFHIFLLLVLINFMTCEKWNLDKANFVSIKTGEVISTTSTSVSIKGEIAGLGNGKIEEHGHIFSCVNSQPELGQADTETASLGITFDNGEFTNTINDLTLNTTYYVRAFAFAEESTIPTYGETIEVRLGDNVLNVTTDSVDLFTEGFEVFGTLSGLQQGVEISKYGFVWSNDNTEPLVENDEVNYLGLINEDQSFNLKLENIEQLLDYHVRAFVQLGKDVFYGETKSFFKGDVWIPREPAPTNLGRTYFSVVGDAAYIGGGVTATNPDIPNSNFYKFIPSTDTWEIIPSLNQTNGISSIRGAAFAIDNNIYVATGEGNIDKGVWAFDTNNEMWSQNNDFPGPFLVSTLSATVQGRGVIGWGVNLDIGEPNTTFANYDAQTDMWEEISTFPNSGRFISFILSNGDELFVGFDTQSDSENLWSYNIGTEEWIEKPNSTIPGLFPKGVSGFSIGNKGYIVMSVGKDNCWEYNMVTNRWKQKADYPGSIKSLPTYFTIDGTAYYGMGIDVLQNKTSSDMWEYIPDIEEL